MSAEQALRDGRLDEALKLLQDQVRQKPAEPALRVFLFQLLCVLGQWERALNQLNVAAELDAGTLAMANTYRPALECEPLRAAVFEGKHTPVVFGAPEAWLAPLIQALAADAEGRHALAEDLRAQAFEQAPANPGTADGEAFPWFADADPRLGPVFEAVINGRYCWLPMQHVQQVDLEKVSDLRDLVWLPAHIVLANGGELYGLLPSRYPGTESQEDGALRLARKTEWTEAGLPLGLRMFAAEERDYSLFDLEKLVFTPGGA
ncbi:MAG: tetratricopeptide repeat protein [Gammaproteobacteria bacterium]|nr:tetratricopeptide repeat protein [Gammaproteobacteria bacterium]